MNTVFSQYGDNGKPEWLSLRQVLTSMGYLTRVNIVARAAGVSGCPYPGISSPVSIIRR